MKYVLALDQGTTSSRALVFGLGAAIVVMTVLLVVGLLLGAGALLIRKIVRIDV